jgi:arylsulfatase A-like enzyme
MVSYGPPHPTHAAPSSYRGELPPEWLNLVNAELLNYRNNVPEWIIPYNQGQNGDRPTSVGAQEYLWGYYSAILSIDESVRRLVEGIDALGITGETIICFASDHGDMGGSHGVFRKGVAYSEATDVPLGFSWPGVIHQSVAPIPASLIDIAPTLASLAGVAIPSEWQGQDLSPWLLGDDAEPPKSVYSEGGYNSDKPWQLIRTPNWSYSVNRNDGNPIALFDTTNDPYQMVNLVNSSLAKDVIPSLSAELMSWNLRGIY